MSRSEGGGGEESVGGDGKRGGVGGAGGSGGSLSDDVGAEALGGVRVDHTSA